MNLKDLTCGRPVKLIVLFALPLLLGNIFQQAYSLADIAIIGKNMGNGSIAAVGATMPLVSLMFNLVNGSVTGFAIVVAKNYGAGDFDEMRRTLARMFVFSMSMAVLIIAVCAIFTDPMLHALNASDDIFDEAKSYFLIVILGLVVTMLYNYEAAVLRAVGDSVIPLVILVVSSALNIGLDLLFVNVFKAGVVGAALATVASQAICAAACLLYLMKKRPLLLFHRRDIVFTKKSTAELLSSGLGMALMYSIVDIGSVILQNGINGFDNDNLITAHTAARKIFGLIIMPFSASSATLVTYCSQNRGAGKYSRIKRGIRDGILLMLGWAAIALILIFFAGEFLVGLIVDTHSDEGILIMKTAVYYLKWAAPFFFCLAALLGFRSSLQGLGNSAVPIVCSVIELLWKIVTVWLMIPLFGGNNGQCGESAKDVGGYFGVIISEPIVWAVCSIVIGMIIAVTLHKLPADKESDEKRHINKMCSEKC